MTLAVWQAPITDAAGNLVLDASVEVRREITGSPLALLYADRDGAVSKGNAFTLVPADNGLAKFYAVGGFYRIRAYKGAESYHEWRDVAIGTAAAVDAPEFIESGYFYELQGDNTAPPAERAVRFDNDNLTLATKAYVSKLTQAGVDITSRLLELDSTGKSVKNTAIFTDGEGLQGSFKVDTATLVDSDPDYVQLVLSSHAGASALTVGIVTLSREISGGDGIDSGGMFSRVRFAATGNINLATPGATIDGGTPALGDTFLAPAQSTAHQNGIYIWNGAAVAATRHADFATYANLCGIYISVMEGTVNADTLWRSTSDLGGTIGVTAVTFEQLATSLAGQMIVLVNDQAALRAINTARYTAAAIKDMGLFRWDPSNLATAGVTSERTVTFTNVNDTANVMDLTAHAFVTGEPLYLAAVTNGLAIGVYYVIKANANSISLAASFAAAMAGTVLDFTGTANFTFDAIRDPSQHRYVIRTADRLNGADGAWRKVSTQPFITVAAPNSTSEAKAIADYVATTSHSQVALKMAVEEAKNAEFGKVVCAPGEYVFSQAFEFPDALVNFEFDAAATVFATTTTTDDIVRLQGANISRFHFGTLSVGGGNTTGAGIKIVSSAAGFVENIVTWSRLFSGPLRNGIGLYLNNAAASSNGIAVNYFKGTRIEGWGTGIKYDAGTVHPGDTNVFDVNFLFGNTICIDIVKNGSVRPNSNTWRCNIDANGAGRIGVRTDGEYDYFEGPVLALNGASLVTLNSGASYNRFNWWPDPHVAFPGTITDSSGNNTNFAPTSTRRKAVRAWTMLVTNTNPYNYQNTTQRAQTVIVQGGTYATTMKSIDGTTYYDTGATSGEFTVGPGEYLRVRDSSGAGNLRVLAW